MRTLGTSSILVVLLLAFGWSAPAHSQSRGVTIRSLGLCLDVDHAVASPGTNVMLWTCTGSPNQRWIFDGGLIRSALGPNLCLDIDHARTEPGTNVMIWSCTGSPNQRWVLENGAIRSALPGSMCLDAYQAVASPGTNVVSWNCNGQANQTWTLE
jgi:hypothetical protein